MTAEAYNEAMGTWQNPNEDWRGVDLTQIRAQLRLSVKDRVEDMVRAANVLMAIRENARRSREAQSR